MQLRCPNTLWSQCTFFLCHWGRQGLEQGCSDPSWKPCSVCSPYRWQEAVLESSPWKVSFSLTTPFLFSVFSFHKFSRTSQGTNPLFFPLATLMKPLCSSSLLTQIWKCVDRAALSSCLWQEFKLEMTKKCTHLSLFQGDLPLFLTANKGSVTSEHPVACPHLMRKGCREKTYSIFNHTLELLVRYTRC